ncbi:NAD(P)/FAD-dependent oxidoreductase [Undibacterium sp. Ji67W]|uniref:NAD(P)/FAD-dependent oxidoreductase n=1 Tax=Undibacterium sp. Ji67W TaxID=3413042 RepID=UPI003BF3E826
MHIRNTVLRRLAASELETDEEKIRALGHFVVIGGGFSGVEVAGELVDCLASIQHFYPRIKKQYLKVTVIHDGDRLLPELPASLGMAAQSSLTKRGVAIHLARRATSISDVGVHFADGLTIAGATVISTVGTCTNPLLETLGLALSRGRIAVQADMQVIDAPGLWAAGDCALIPNAHDNDFAPPTAQFAVVEGKLVAENILAHIANKPTRSFKHQSRGMMAAIGHMRGVAEVFGIQFSGLPAWLLWRAYYLSQMPTLGRKVRIFVEWTWGMFFSVDITHLRFTRSGDVEKEE